MLSFYRSKAEIADTTLVNASNSLNIVVTACGNKSKCVGEYTQIGMHDGKPWYRNPSGAIIYFRESWKMNDNDSKAGWYYSVTEMAPSRSTTGSAIAVGCSVRVRASVATPRYDWGPVSHASVGKLLRIDEGGVRHFFGPRLRLA